MEVGQVERMEKIRNAYWVLVGKPEGKRHVWRLRHKWEDNNKKIDIKETGRDGVNRMSSSGLELVVGFCEHHNEHLGSVKIRIISWLGKGLLQQAEVAQGVPGRLRPRIFLMFGTTRVVSRQPLRKKKSLVLSFRGWVDPRAHGSVGSYGENPQWHHRESIPRPSD